MPAPRKYPPELIERGVQMVAAIRHGDPGRPGVIRQVGELLDIHPEVLRHWVKKADVESEEKTQGVRRETLNLRRLERENAELRRENGILKAAAILFAAEIGRAS
ncbi:transposase [Streptomyces griseoaurantiacus]|uniref:transposase n=1 Tax=Streptomyces griseoaurantiacus TaxID=68213 RepID=UPI003460E869